MRKRSSAVTFQGLAKLGDARGLGGDFALERDKAS
jgi:hypothetical protein